MSESSSERPYLWFEVLGGRYPGTEPYFYDVEEFEWTQTLRDNWEIIKDEMEALLADEPKRLRPYLNDELSYPPRQWKTIGFYFWSWRLLSNCKRCPRTMLVLSSIPYLTGASLNVLEPGANINPHQGDTNAQIKAHLGLSIPAELPDCGFQVGPEIRAWQDGEMLLFCDAHRHTAWNHSGERRLIFMLDVLRPEFASRADYICTHVLASTMLQVVYARLPFIGARPGRVRHALLFLTRHVMRVLLGFNRLARGSRP